MQTSIQSGFKVRYKAWSDLEIQSVIIEGAVKYKKKDDGLSSFHAYSFFDKKGKLLLHLGCAQII